MTAIPGMFLDMPVVYARCIIACMIWQGQSANEKQKHKPVDFLEDADQLIKRSGMLRHPLLSIPDETEPTNGVG